eukprot:scaffold1790_cov257-Pinguiococcus_pyrenoidosus.AAC.19
MRLLKFPNVASVGPSRRRSCCGCACSALTLRAVLGGEPPRSLRQTPQSQVRAEWRTKTTGRTRTTGRTTPLRKKFRGGVRFEEHFVFAVLPFHVCRLWPKAPLLRHADDWENDDDDAADAAGNFDDDEEDETLKAMKEERKRKGGCGAPQLRFLNKESQSMCEKAIGPGDSLSLNDNDVACRGGGEGESRASQGARAQEGGRGCPETHARAQPACDGERDGRTASDARKAAGGGGGCGECAGSVCGVAQHRRVRKQDHC